MRYANRWTIGDWTFYEVTDHGFRGGSLFAFGDGTSDDKGKPRTGEFYLSLDRAMIAAVGEKYAGKRGAGGTGVGTAADWFTRMVGIDELVAVDYSTSQKVVDEALAASQTVESDRPGRGNRVLAELESRGIVLAALNHDG